MARKSTMILFLMLVGVLVFLLGASFLAFVVVLCSENPTWIFKLVGVCQKYEVLKFLGIGMGGILLALQALASHRRAKAMEDAAIAQANATEEQAKANQHTEQGQRQERLKNAIEHLGHKSDSVRLGGAYELFQLAKDAKIDADDTKDSRQTVLDILCAHIRWTTGENEYRETHKSKPSEEIQSLLTLLFVQQHEVFKGLRINLQQSWLNGANLQKARLENAVIVGASLQEANLREARLQGAELVQAHLQAADLFGAHLQAAGLGRANLQGTYLVQSWLQQAWFVEACLQAADLRMANLQGANLKKAHLQAAEFSWTQLQAAMLEGTHLHGAKSRFDDDWTAAPFAERIRESIGRESDLSGVIFEGGLSLERVDSLVKGLSDNAANELREKLESHIGKPESDQLPEDSRAITGTYTEEEAEKWIAEYEEAMSQVPGDDS